MALDVIFGPTQIAGLPGQPLSQSIPSDTANCYVIINVTPYWWALVDADHNANVAVVPPWSIAQGNLGQQTNTLTLASNTALPTVAVSSADSAAQQVAIELARGAVSPQIVSLSIAAAADVNISGGSITANISGGTVSLSAGTVVGITGTVTVAGSVSVTNSPTVNISGSGNTVQLVAGTSVGISGTVTIAGSVDIANSPTVNISGTGNTVSLEAGTTVNIGGTATVEWSSTGPVSVQNLRLNTNNLVLLSQARVTVTNLANGASFVVAGDTNNTGNYPYTQYGLYDGFVFVVHTTAGYLYSGPTYVQVFVSGVEPAFVSGYASTTPTWAAQPGLDWNGGSGLGTIVWYAQAPFLAMFGNVVLTNTTGGTIASDTVWVTILGIKAQVSNPTANPVQQQASAGSYDATVGTNNTQESVPNAAPNTAYNFSVIASGNNLKSLVSVNGISVTYGNAGSVGTSTFTVYNGSQAIYQQTFQPGGQATSTAPSFALSFGDGVPNAGISITWEFTGTTQNASTTVVNSGIMYAITASTTPPVEVTTVA